jgi:hypothetical protein
LSTQTLTKRIKDKAYQLGFTLVGVTSPEPLAHLDIYRRWIVAGAWALGGAEAQSALAKARAQEKDDWVLEEIDAALKKITAVD